MGNLVGGSLLASLGAVALLVSLYRRRRIDAALASFGTFALLYGARLFFMSELMPALGVSRLTVYWITNTIGYLIQIPAWFFFYQILGPGPHSIVLWWLRIISAFAILGVASDLVQGLGSQIGASGGIYRGNFQLVHNLIDWALADTDLLQIRGSGAFARTLVPLSDAEKSRWELANYLVVLMALAIIVGIAATTRRRARPMLAARASGEGSGS